MKLRVIDKNKQLMRIDHEDKHKSKIASSLYKTVESIIDSFDAIIISDYGKGAVKPIIKKVLKIASKLNIMTFIDPKGDDFTFYKGAYLLKPNQKEFENIMGTSKTTDEFKVKGEKLRKELKLNSLLVTRGKDGMMLFEKNQITSFKAIQQDVFDVTGAGDTVISIVASYMTSGENMISAVTMSNIAAGLSVQKLGSTSVSQEDLSNAANK
jgi:D-beta-D-heptose 7-phosphate kinase/D-beta-D-heptose 1-phosphate adenosyltransferase